MTRSFNQVVPNVASTDMDKVSGGLAPSGIPAGFGPKLESADILPDSIHDGDLATSAIPDTCMGATAGGSLTE